MVARWDGGAWLSSCEMLWFYGESEAGERCGIGRLFCSKGAGVIIAW
jgi:hypothetical protein